MMNFWLPIELVAMIAVISGIIGLFTFIGAIVEYRERRDYIGMAITAGLFIPACVATVIWLNYSVNAPYKVAEEHYYKPVKIDFDEHGTVQIIYSKNGPRNANALVGRIIPEGSLIKHTTYEDTYYNIKYERAKETWEVVKEK